MIDIEIIKSIAKKAGIEILKIYSEADFDIKNKSDESPVTLADLLSNKIITEELTKHYPSIPILSEESAHASYEIRKSWTELFIVDPLDGTKEFIKKNGEFAINIAYMKNGVIIDGLIYSPVSKEIFYTKNNKSYKEINGEELELPIFHNEPFRVFVSKSHYNEETKKLIDLKRIDRPDLTEIKLGSALKFCKIAEGYAHFYPRIAPTSEWDTAAAEPILRNIGYKIINAETGNALIYNKENLLNPSFIVDKI